jgi:hypothetical protein
MPGKPGHLRNRSPDCKRLRRGRANRMISMPKPGSTFSILSQSSLVRHSTSRTGYAGPIRIACIRLSTKPNSRSSRLPKNSAAFANVA